MAGLPRKILNTIENDVKKKLKLSGEPWQGFGPVAEAHMSPCQNKVIVVWRQGGYSDTARTTHKLGIYYKPEDTWLCRETHHCNYDPGSKVGVEAIVRKERGRWA